MKRKLLLILLPLAICSLVVIVQLVFSGLVSKPKSLPNSNLIESNPINLAQISEISKFRSCQGHNFNGYNVQGEYEDNRSMKHYIQPKLSSITMGIEVYAPFSGEIVYIIGDNRGRDMFLRHETSEWLFQFFHINPVDGLKEGDKVIAGQLLGYAQTPENTNFDIALIYVPESILNFISTRILRFGTPPFFNYNASYFDYLSEEVELEYLEAGINPEQMSHSKEYRDNVQCDFNKERVFHDDDWMKVDAIVDN